MKKYSIVIPCYNEEGNIPLIINRISEMAAGNDDLEVVLVDNGSTDGSASVFSELLGKGDHPHIRLVSLGQNQGYGYGILAGLEATQGRYLAWTHADMQTDPADALRAFELIEESVDPERTFVKGVRKKRGLLDVVFTFGMTIVSSMALGMWLSDVNAQPKAFSRAFYNAMSSPPRDFSLDLYVLYLASKERYARKSIPVLFEKRMHGVAKGGGSMKTKWLLIKRTFAYILKLRAALRG